MKTEQQIFDELAVLCASRGYIHALSYLCFRDNVVRYHGEMQPEDLQALFSTSRLIRTEIATLIGMMVKADIDYFLPDAHTIQTYLDKTEELLEELHQAIIESSFLSQPDPNASGAKFPYAAFREPIFYNGESAYNFQFRDFSIKKYESDDEWLIKNKGFRITDAREVVRAIGLLETRKMNALYDRMARLPRNEWTFLPVYCFELKELCEAAGLDPQIVVKVLAAFTLQEDERNANFRSLHDFNAISAFPVLKGPAESLVLLGQYFLSEALYDSPFYWMLADNDYRDVACKNRGIFCETFARDRLVGVFGEDSVYFNVDIFESESKKLGEIDVLVIFGNRAIVVQSKSKRLTIDARRGNDRQIKDDFQKSVQDSYDQGWKCASLIREPKYKLMDRNATQIHIGTPLVEIHILCIVSDSYPALNFQAQHLLQYRQDETIRPPLVFDIFTLDAITEMLESPLYCLSYITRRAEYHGQIISPDELTILSLHLRKNLWIPSGSNVLAVEGDVSIHLDAAMTVRRDGVPGRRTPEGILTRVVGTALGKTITQIESSPHPGTLSLGLLILRLSEDAVHEISRGMEIVAERARVDGKSHNVSVDLPEAKSGLTIHYNDGPIVESSQNLRRHCRIRKYIQKASSWFGICISPSVGAIRVGAKLEYEWEPNKNMDELANLWLGSN